MLNFLNPSKQSSSSICKFCSKQYSINSLIQFCNNCLLRQLYDPNKKETFNIPPDKAGDTIDNLRLAIKTIFENCGSNQNRNFFQRKCNEKGIKEEEVKNMAETKLKDALNLVFHYFESRKPGMDGKDQEYGFPEKLIH